MSAAVKDIPRKYKKKGPGRVKSKIISQKSFQRLLALVCGQENPPSMVLMYSCGGLLGGNYPVSVNSWPNKPNFLQRVHHLFKSTSPNQRKNPCTMPANHPLQLPFIVFHRVSKAVLKKITAATPTSKASKAMPKSQVRGVLGVSFLGLFVKDLPKDSGAWSDDLRPSALESFKW